MGRIDERTDGIFCVYVDFLFNKSHTITVAPPALKLKIDHHDFVSSSAHSNHKLFLLITQPRVIVIMYGIIFCNPTVVFSSRIE